MSTKIVSLFATLLVSLLVGVMGAVWMQGHSVGSSPAESLALQRHLIDAFNTPMPRLGGLSLLFTLAWALLERRSLRIVPVSIATACLIGAALITFLINQPINARVTEYNPAATLDWSRSRAEWWLWHDVRTLSSLTALVMLLIAARIDTGRAGPARWRRTDNPCPDAARGAAVLGTGLQT